MKFHFFNSLLLLLAIDNVEFSLELNGLENASLVMANSFMEIEPFLLLLSHVFVEAKEGFSNNSFGVETLSLILYLFVQNSPHPLV